MNLEKLEKIMEKGFDLNIIALLYICKQGESLISANDKIKALVGMMERKGLIMEGRITASGEELLGYIEEKGEIIKEKEKTSSLEDLYDKVIAKVEELTGKKQIRTEIYGKTYSYLPGKYDFVSRLRKVANKYSLTNMTILEETIIRNIERCYKTKKWYPLLVYYMVKDDVSPLAADYQNWEELKEEEFKEIKSNDTII